MFSSISQYLFGKLDERKFSLPYLQEQYPEYDEKH